MSVTIRIDNKELQKALRNVSQWSEAKTKRVKAAVATAALNVDRKAKEGVPVDMGRLRSSITPAFQNAGLSASVSTNVVYAPFVEFGRGPGKMPPLEPIKEWARRHGLPEGAAFPIARKIGREGTKAQPFMHPAAESERVPFKRAMIQALQADERVNR